jgi:hypothetical protein
MEKIKFIRQVPVGETLHRRMMESARLRGLTQTDFVRVAVANLINQTDREKGEGTA